MQRRGWRSMWPGLWFGKNVKEAPIDFKDKKHQYEIYAEIPGISKDNIEVHVTPHNMAIKGKTKIEKKKKEKDIFGKNEVIQQLLEQYIFQMK
jgi:HSP20 family molecular chaperone IbpA